MNLRAQDIIDLFAVVMSHVINEQMTGQEMRIGIKEFASWANLHTFRRKAYDMPGLCQKGGSPATDIRYETVSASTDRLTVASSPLGGIPLSRNHL